MKSEHVQGFRKEGMESTKDNLKVNMSLSRVNDRDYCQQEAIKTSGTVNCGSKLSTNDQNVSKNGKTFQ